MNTESKVVKVSSKGWIVIPKEMRERKGIRAGGKVLVEEEEAGLRVTPLPHDPIETSFGLLRGGESLVEALLKERAREKEHEERLIKETGSRRE